MFELFDPQRDYQVTAGNLPHWYQPGVTYFVTFRTEDSLPTEVADRWRRGRDDWLRRQRINPTNKSWKAELRRLSRELQREFHRTFSEAYLALLDKGLRACELRRPQLANEVSDSLLHFDGTRYHMGDFVVMPNHVHFLTCLLGYTEIEEQCFSWKKFMAGKINEHLGRKGRFWQEESFDHLVRTPEEFGGFRAYIAENGPRAGLREGEYLYYRSPKL